MSSKYKDSSDSKMYTFCAGVLKKIHKFQHWNEFRIDTLALIIYNYFIVFLVANKDMEWAFHPFKDDIIGDKYGLQFNRPVILPKFGIIFRWLTLVCNLFGLLPFIYPKKQYQSYLLPVLIWNVYTVTALVENILQILMSIIYLQVPLKVVFSVFASGVFVTFFYLKLILQVVNFYEHLHLSG